MHELYWNSDNYREHIHLFLCVCVCVFSQHFILPALITPSSPPPPSIYPTLDPHTPNQCPLVSHPRQSPCWSIREALTL